jgi:DHA2 family multidrug resistance protein
MSMVKQAFVPRIFTPAVAWAIFGAMVFGNFMAILDIQIVASSLNEIQAGMSASRSEVAWVQTTYLIAEVIAIPLSSLLSQLLSTRIYFSLCALGFALSSLMCGLAWNLESLLFFRAIQGFVGGGMIPSSMAALFTLFPENKRSAPMVMIGMVSTLGPAIGPTLGGWLTTHFSWHWMFFINLAPGLLVASQVYSGDDIDEANPTLFNRIDWTGLVSMAVFLGCLEYFLDEGARHDWFADQSVLISFVAMVIGGSLFLYRSFTAKYPILDLQVFRDRNFAVSSLMTFVVGMVLYGMVYLTPVFLGQVRGMNSSEIGRIMMVMGITMFISSPFIGSILPRFDARKTIFIGLTVAATGVWMNANLTMQSDYDDFFWPQILRGMGLMLCLIVMSQLAMATLPMEKIKSASALYNLTRNIGGAIGLAFINITLDRLTAVHVTELDATMTPANPAFIDRIQDLMKQFAALGDGAEQAAISILYREEHLQALTSSFNDLLKIVAIAMFSIGFLVFLLKKPKPLMGGGEAH